MTLSRRRFARLVALSGSAFFLPDRAGALAGFGLREGPLPPTPRVPDEKFWGEVRSRFVLPRDFGFFNAANLCPTPLPVLEALERNTRALDADPSPATRARLGQGREAARRRLAEFLGVTPEEIVITRNTSEANNLVSSGIGLGPDDEVVVFGDNHPSNLAAWHEKARRFGFAVTVVPQVNPHPGAEYYLDGFTRALTPRTRVLAVTHVTNSVGDALPVAELCRLAREREILSLEARVTDAVRRLHGPAGRSPVGQVLGRGQPDDQGQIRQSVRGQHPPRPPARCRQGCCAGRTLRARAWRVADARTPAVHPRPR